MITYILSMTSKLSDPKVYWSMLNRFLYYEKISSIPPLLFNNKFFSDFRVKANLFNDFFFVCTPINNGSALPQFAYKTDVKINSFPFNQNDISLIIKALITKRAHDWDNISIKMIQICGNSIALPLIYLKQHWKIKKILDISKKGNVAPVYEKRSQ